MTWPWVSRERFDDMRDSRDAERERSQALFRELVAVLHPVVAAVVDDAPAPVVILADPIREVIREQAYDQSGREDHQLASHLRKYARQLKREGKSDDEIIGALVQWQTSEASM